MTSDDCACTVHLNVSLFSQSIYISKITPYGAAARNGQIQIGDKILTVNGADVTRATHEDIVSRLTAPAPSVALTLYREQLVRKGSINADGEI